jgi:spore coat protein H
MQVDSLYPDFEHPGMKIENRICLDLPEMQLRSLHSTPGKKIEVKTGELIINGDTLLPERIHTRGQSTLMYRRKSLNINLNTGASFRRGERTKILNKFLLLSLSMDKYYCSNHLAFQMVDTLDLFKLFYSFCELKINGRSEGVFMVVERPEDWALKRKKAPLVIRRGMDHRMDEIKTNDRIDRNETRKHEGDYRQIYRSLNKYDGRELYEVLLKYIEIDMYMKWLAFNFLVHNGDYSDEVFFYIDPGTGRYRIIPWDFDDILAIAPHEGAEQRNTAIGEKLLFSSEDLLDRKIATDPYLYEVYKKKMKEVLEIVTPYVLKHTIERTYAELHPYYSDNEIILNVQFDQNKNANIENLRTYLTQIYFLLCDYRRTYLEYLDLNENKH